jgi:hypothetical protein
MKFLIILSLLAIAINPVFSKENTPQEEEQTTEEKSEEEEGQEKGSSVGNG